MSEKSSFKAPALVCVLTYEEKTRSRLNGDETGDLCTLTLNMSDHFLLLA